MREEDKEPELKIKRVWHDLYVEKESNPFDDRTDKKFCEDNLLSIDALCSWKRRNRKEIYEEVNKRLNEFKKEIRAKANKALMAKIGKDTNALKLTYQLLGDLVERQETKLEYHSEQDIKRRINDLLTTISEKKAAWDSAPVDDGTEARQTSPTVEKGPEDSKKPSDLSDGTQQPGPA